MWVFCLLFLCSCVGGSFRSGGSTPDRHRGGRLRIGSVGCGEGEVVEV